MKATTSDVEREALRGALHAIAAQAHGVLNLRAIVETARDPQHLLHGQFEWDDTLAGEAYRLAQAGGLCRRLRIDVVRRDAVTREVTITTTRGLQSRPSMRTRAGGYEAVEAILADVAKREELLSQVLRELGAYRKRYAELIELETVWAALDDVLADRTSVEGEGQAASPAPGDGAPAA